LPERSGSAGWLPSSWWPGWPGGRCRQASGSRSSLGCGAALLYGRSWDGALVAAAVLAACLVIVTGVGVAQARRMTRLRQQAQRQPGNTKLAGLVRRGALSAAVLRAVIAALSLALIALGVLLTP
jgi:hypothetical protein